MARNFRALVAALGLLALLPGAAVAQSGCGGQGVSGAICGNAGAGTSLPSLVSVTTLLDRAMGSSQGRVLQRGSGGWAASPNPTLGVNGSVGGAITLNGSSSGSVTVRVPAAAGGTVFQLPSSNGTAGFVLTTDGAGNTSWLNNAAGGTVTSVGLSMPGIFSVSGSPVTTTGTLTATLATQAANLVWSGPTTGAAATPTFRALVGADLPNPSASTLGGVQSFAAVSSQWIRQISTSGVPTASQPAFTDISGTMVAAQCPLPGASSIGCVQSFAVQASKWISSISTLGVPSATQPAFSDISGSLASAQLPTISTSSVLGNASGGTAVPTALTATQVLDFIGSTQGQVLYRNGTIWTVLAPGTSGQVLTTGGAAANPAWATVTGTGTVTNVATGTGLTGGPITTTGTIQFATIANNSILANVSGGALAPSATTLSAVLDIAGSTTGNILYRASGGSGWTVLAPGSNGQVLTMGASTPAWGSAGSVSTVSTGGIVTGGPITTTGTVNINATITPQGRITLTSATPVMAATVTGATTVYYTPYKGNLVPIYDGTNFVPTAIAELSVVLGASWVTNSNYDVFIASDAGTIRACTGPAWTSSTARGSGAGTTELSRTNGMLLNTVTLTCRYNNTTTFSVAASRGTYVGTFRTSGSGAVTYGLGGSGSGGVNGILGVWNMYNRVLATARTTDSGVSYTYSSATIRQARASAGNQGQVLIGVAEDSILAQYFTRTDSTTAAGSYGSICIGVNTTSGCAMGRTLSLNSGTASAAVGFPQQTYAAPPLLGYNTYSANEGGDGANNSIFNAESTNVLTLSAWN